MRYLAILGLFYVLLLSSITGSSFILAAQPDIGSGLDAIDSGGSGLVFGSVRTITYASECPEIILNGDARQMSVRAEPNVDFAILTCEALNTPEIQQIELDGRVFEPPPSNPQRIAVVGDTGCRLKSGSGPDDGFQACNDPAEWPFNLIAQQIASLEPDLIIHVGDSIYRETPCPEGNEGCAGSPYNSAGLRLETWMADFFTPAQPLFEAAPIVFVRGNHELCRRAGRGFMRFTNWVGFQACADFTAPYLLSFDELQLVVMDLIQTEDTELASDEVIDRYTSDFELLRERITEDAWLLSHIPIWAVQTSNSDGTEVEALTPTLQKAASGGLPDSIEFVLTGHIHLGEVLNFSGNRPPDITVGNSGTKLLPDIEVDLVGMEIDGETITSAYTFAEHAFALFEPSASGGWNVSYRGVDGNEAVELCR